MTDMAHRFDRESPRLSPRAVPVASRLIGMIGPVMFLALTVQAFLRHGLASWAVGVAYILYDTALLGFTAWNILPLSRYDRSAAAPATPTLARPDCAVIVAAHNEAAVLGITIDTLAAQADAPDLILLADDGSDDDSAAVLARLYGLATPPLGQVSAPSPTLPSLRWLRLPHGGKARALNAAILHIDTELMLTVDADTLLAPGALAAMRAAFADEPELVAATGVLVPICSPNWRGRLFELFQRYEYVRNFLSRYGWMRQQSLLLISGAFAGFRRAAVVEIGGFDPDCMVEDYELIHRLHRRAADTGKDWRVRVIGAAIASTDAPDRAIAFLRQRRRWFGGFLQTQRWNRDMVGAAKYGPLGTRMLVVKALDTLQPVYGLAAFAILIWLLVSGRFAVALPIVAIMLAKVAVDLTFHFWSLAIYKRWTGQSEGLGLGAAIAVAVAEPFSFQLLRHIGAVWGWIAFLSGRGRWVRHQRGALEALPQR